jgi:hypothetical protein
MKLNSSFCLLGSVVIIAFIILYVLPGGNSTEIPGPPGVSEKAKLVKLWDGKGICLPCHNKHI